MKSQQGLSTKLKMRTFLFKINLFRHKQIIREIEVPENFSLYKLANAIVTAYDFNFDHAFGFFDKIGEQYYKSDKKYELFADMEDIEPTGAESVEKTKINQAWQNVGNKMLFLFDYGDNWLFVVELTGFSKKMADKKYPRLLKKVGVAPEQYPEIEEDEKPIV